MRIKRIQVEEGFLDGLDLEFKPGLNVLIGARGTGKTSVIELLRFALSAPAFTEQAADRSFQQALGVLAGGRVTVTAEEGGQLISVTRQASSDEDVPDPRVRVTVMAQNELESVASQASGRLRLIDRLIPELAGPAKVESRLSAEVRSMTVELNGLLSEGLKLAASLEDLRTDPEELQAARSQQQQLLASVAATQDDQQGLITLQAEGARRAASDQKLRQSIAEVDAFQKAIRNASRVPSIQDVAEASDQLQAVHQALSAAAADLRTAESSAGFALLQLQELLAANTQSRVDVEERVRTIRSKLEQLQEGASALTRRVATLEEREAQRVALQQRIDERRAAFNRLFDERQSKYRELDEARAQRSEMRLQRVDDLSETLAPTVKIELTRSAATDAYASAIIACLRGSGIHYRALAPLLARSMSPLELVEAAEFVDAEAISEATGIALDRATAVATALRSSELETLISVLVEDSVELYLLDGARYKSSAELSIGQRCTVILPILLADRGDVLIIDQPEDHLDNAFIAETLVPGLLRRSPSDQVILSSHNANIPVLGEADMVVLMGSDGRRGFVAQAGKLEAPQTVDAITRVMEGGRKAFARRASFYGSARS